MADIVLYGNQKAGHAYKVRLALTLAGVPHRYRHVDLDVPRHLRPEPFRALATFGQVPVLVDGGHPMVQSNAILIHLASARGVLPGPAASFARVLEWLMWEANRIGFSLPKLRAAVTVEPVSHDVSLWLKRRVLDEIETLDQHLAKQPFLAGAEPTVADISVCAYLFAASEARVDVAQWESVGAWLGRIRALPRFEPQDELMAAGRGEAWASA